MPIKTWKFSETANNAAKEISKVILHEDRVEFHSFYYPNPRRYSFDEVLLIPYPIGNLSIDYEILKHLVGFVNRADLSPESQYIFDFYTAFDNKKIQPESLELESKEGDFARYFRCLNTCGLEMYYERTDGKWNMSQQRFSQFFFYGPEMTLLPLEVRTRWRLQVWEALGENPPFALEEAFALFDYAKIPLKNFTWQSTERDEGEYFNLEYGKANSGGWSGRDGGSGHRSIESVWYFGAGIFKSLEQHKPEILSLLEMGYVEGRKGFAIRPEKAEEAPPA